MSAETDLAIAQAKLVQAQSDMAAVSSAVVATSTAATKVTNDLSALATELATVATDLGTPPPPPPPTSLTLASINSVSATVGSPITAISLSASGGTAPVTYTVSPALPAGLSLIASTIAGIPTAASGPQTYTVTATDASSPKETASQSFSITVAAATPPPSTSTLYGTAVNNGWGNVTSGEASAKALGASIVQFGDYWASGGYPFATIKAMPFPKFLLTTHLWASSGQYTQASFLAALKTPNSPQLASFVSIAQGMASTGKQSIIRLSAEPEGGWEPDNATADPVDYSASLDIIIPAMVAVNPTLEFTLDFDNGWFNIPGTGTEFNPGTLYSAALLALPQVKYVGMDTYAEFWGTVPSGQTMSQANWNQLLTNQYGLQWLATFAKAHNLQVGISEFGPSIRTSGGQVVGTGDDPYFITQFFNWFKGLGANAGFVCFFDVNASDGNHNITGGSFPNSLAAAKTAIA